MINFHSILGGFIPKKVEMVPNAKGIGPDYSAVFQFTSAAFVSSQNQEASEHSNLALERGGVIKIQLAWNSKTQKENVYSI